jgi:hypothetical protein
VFSRTRGPRTTHSCGEVVDDLLSASNDIELLFEIKIFIDRSRLELLDYACLSIPSSCNVDAPPYVLESAGSKDLGVGDLSSGGVVGSRVRHFGVFCRLIPSFDSEVEISELVVVV